MSQIAQQREDEGYEWQWIDNQWQWKPKNYADLLLDKIPSRKEFNEAFDKSYVGAVDVLNTFNNLVVNTANGIVNELSSVADTANGVKDSKYILSSYTFQNLLRQKK